MAATLGEGTCTATGYNLKLKPESGLSAATTYRPTTRLRLLTKSFDTKFLRLRVYFCLADLPNGQD